MDAVGGFSNCPEMHRKDLEIGGAVKTDEVKQVEPGFHFSEENDGDYWFFYLFNIENPHNRRMMATCDGPGARASRIADLGKASVD